MANKKKVEQPNRSNSGKSVTLKRTVTIKALVTDKFKQYMQFEVNEALKNSQLRINQIDSQVKEIEKALAEKPGDKFRQRSLEQLKMEKGQLLHSAEELQNRSKAITQMKNGEYFTQGMVDGFVTVNIGDNLYEKLGGMEILLNDGIIQEINPVSKPVA